ncbi:MAG: hypothetical protein OHK0057_31870 [Thermoflexibacter sp.]
MRKIGFILLILLSACQTDQSIKWANALENLKKAFNFSLQNGYCLVISFEGCSSCRSKAIAFLEKNLAYQEMRYILSAKQKRIIGFSVSEEALANANVLIDTNYHAHSLGLVSDFPVLYHIKNGMIKEVKTLSATNIDEELHLLEIRLQKKLLMTLLSDYQD